MQLAAKSRDIARQQKRWDMLAAFDAWEFFERPSIDNLRKLLKSARRLKKKEVVRTCADDFLTRGTSPLVIKSGADGKKEYEVADGWPLPPRPHLIPLCNLRGSTGLQPRFDLLMEMAIAEKRFADVIQIYHGMCSVTSVSSAPLAGSTLADQHAQRVASVLTQTHPHVSLEIYVRQLNRTAPASGDTAYEAIAHYFRKMIPIMESIGRADDWRPMVADLRQRFNTDHD